MTYPETSPDKSVVTSALVQPIAVPTHGPGGSFTVLAKVYISGSPTAALNAVRNTNTWPTWNTFCPSCKFPASKTPAQASSLTSENGGETASSGEGWLEKGIVATITYVMSPGGSSGEQGIEITILDHEFVSEEGKGHRIAWKSTGRAHWSLHSERVMEFIDDGEGGCDYVCWETFGGGLGAAVKLAVGGKLRDRFGDYARDLKAFVEGGSVIA